MKVLYPILHYPPVIGGLEQWSQNIAERQPKDTEAYIITGRVKGGSRYEKKNNTIIFRTSLFELKDLSHSSLVYIAGAVPCITFWSLLKARKVDLIHCHGFISALMGCFLSIFAKKPFIGTEQSIIWHNVFSKFVSGIVYRKACLCIAASRVVAEGFAKLGVKNIEIIPNGVDVEKFSPERCLKCAELNSAHGYVRSLTPHINILSVGRLEKIKGHKYLLDAFARIIGIAGSDPAIGGVRPRLIIVGDGSERRNLETQAEKLGASAYVQFIGEIAHDDLPHYYHMADVFIMPSLSEGFGITAIEAMASGAPVVATRAGSLPEIIFDGKTGILVDGEQPEAISRAVVRIFKDRGFAAQLIENGKKRAAEFNWHKSAEKVHKIYQSLA